MSRLWNRQRHFFLTLCYLIRVWFSLNSNPNQVPAAIIRELCSGEAMWEINLMLEPAVSQITKMSCFQSSRALFNKVPTQFLCLFASHPMHWIVFQLLWDCRLGYKKRKGKAQRLGRRRKERGCFQNTVIPIIIWERSSQVGKRGGGEHCGEGHRWGMWRNCCLRLKSSLKRSRTKMTCLFLTGPLKIRTDCENIIRGLPLSVHNEWKMLKEEVSPSLLNRPPGRQWRGLWALLLPLMRNVNCHNFQSV